MNNLEMNDNINSDLNSDELNVDSVTQETTSFADDGASKFRKVDVKDRLADVKTKNIMIGAILCVVVSGISFTSYESDSRASLKTLEQTYKMNQVITSIQNMEPKSKQQIDEEILKINDVNQIINNIKTGDEGKYRQLDKWDSADLNNLIKVWGEVLTISKDVEKKSTKALAGVESLNLALKNREDVILSSTQLYTTFINSEFYKNAFDLNLNTERVLGSINELLYGNKNKKIVVEKTNEYLLNMKTNLNQIKGHTLTPEQQTALKNYEEATSNIYKLIGNDEALLAYADVSSSISQIQLKASESLASNEKILNKFGGNALSDSRNVNLSTSTGLLDDQSKLRFSQALLALGILCGMLIAVIFSRRQRQTQILAKELERNQVNENALVELLESIKPLDDGDFTKPIKAEDKFLSQIANRIDNTRQQFKEIAALIKSNSDGIKMAAESTESSSNELMEISSKQVDKLDSTINVVNNITNAMDEIAQIAWIAQEEANRSADKSEVGDELVNQSVRKMGEIRDTIQESAKKIKKLGESAQSITEVTSLIKDITKQINILALNAAIQAASSGEGGREFTIVAQEVQRLADDSEEATQKIEELITEIQSDTAIAIASMEKTTQEVVVGAKLTEEAGKSLQEINSLSKNTSEQIRGVSERLEEKSQEMAQATFEMRELQKVSDESKEAVNTTSIQVEALRDISDELKVTVEKFKV